jgi:hypothetical protein
MTMKFRTLFLTLWLAATALWLPAAMALPSAEDVQAATQRGDYAGAERLMREVLTAKPDSARGHYVLAEILAHERRFGDAAEHTRRARSLDPAIKFTDPAKFQAFEALIEREQRSEAGATQPRGTAVAPMARAEPMRQASGPGLGTIFLLIGGLIIFIMLVSAWMRRRTAMQPPMAMSTAGGYGAAPMGYPPGGMGGPMAGGGPGLMGVGLAAAGGVAAGMLAEKLLHGHDDDNYRRGDGGASAAPGGMIPGSFEDNSAANDLASRDVDFGSGDGWGGGRAGGGGGDGGGDW